MYEAASGENLIVRRALAFAEYLRQKTIYINPEELIVGSSSSKPLAASIFPEYSVDWVLDELDEFGERPRHKFFIDREHKEELEALCRRWIGYTHFDRVDSSLSLLLGEALRFKNEEAHRYPHINQVLTIEHNQNGDGHIIPNYEKLLNTGLPGVLLEIEAGERSVDRTSADALEKLTFLKAARITIEAVAEHMERYGAYAGKLMLDESNEQRRKELADIQESCRRLATSAPSNFFDAMQLILMVHLLIQVESNGHSISIGRMDQLLYPYFEHDLENGAITREEARDLCEQFILKCHEANKLRDWGTTEILGGNQLFQTITLGGQLKDRRDGVNDLSYLILESLANTNLNIPTVIVSINQNTPIEFVEASVEALKRHRGGMPAFFNDDIAIQSLLTVGVSIQDARNWAGMGCSEVRVPGRHGTGLTPVYVNVLKIFELAMYDGCNPKTGTLHCPSSKSIIDCNSIEDVLELFREQLSHYLSYIPAVESAIAESYFTLTPTPFLSSVVDYRIQQGKDISWGRGSNYNDTIIHAHGFPNVANSLSALDKLVFSSGKYGLSTVIDGMRRNFAAPEFVRLRNDLLNAPKFGNADEGVDSLCNRVFSTFVEEMNKYKPMRGGSFGCTGQTVVMNVQDGEVVGATPDGRLDEEAIADNMSPAPGTDRNGMTSVFNSLSRVDHSLMDNGSILNLKFHPTLVDSKEKVANLARSIKTYFSSGGFQLQLNIIDRDTLIAAQENPEKYSNLIVKVAGFSSYFVELEKKWQDQLISRTEYGV
jgi:pyruvate formate-lyase/glycerol dehydratase family glycyl radical enzyme